MRVVRALLALVLVLLAVPPLIAGAGLWWLMQHRSPDGTFTARIDRVHADGVAVVVPDLVRLVHHDAPLLATGDTSLRVTVRAAGGKEAFIGLASWTEAARYLDALPYAELTEVKPTRGPVPVRVRQIVPESRPTAGDPNAGAGPADPGAQPPADPAAPPADPAAPPADPPADPAAPPSDPGATAAPAAPPSDPGATAAPAAPPPAESAAKPGEQSFWRQRGTSVTWAATGHDQLALVVMNSDGTGGVDVDLTASAAPGWLNRVTWTTLLGGSLLLILGTAILFWPHRRRDFVYVVPPGHVPELAERLAAVGHWRVRVPEHAPPPPPPPHTEDAVWWANPATATTPDPAPVPLEPAGATVVDDDPGTEPAAEAVPAPTVTWPVSPAPRPPAPMPSFRPGAGHLPPGPPVELPEWPVPSNNGGR